VPYGLESNYERFDGAYCIYSPEDGGSNSLRNVGNCSYPKNLDYPDKVEVMCILELLNFTLEPRFLIADFNSLSKCYFF
jgi:hypothetical protein